MLSPGVFAFISNVLSQRCQTTKTQVELGLMHKHLRCGNSTSTRRSAKSSMSSYFLFPSSSIPGLTNLPPVRKKLPVVSCCSRLAKLQLWPFPPQGTTESNAECASCVCVFLCVRQLSGGVDTGAALIIS